MITYSNHIFKLWAGTFLLAIGRWLTGGPRRLARRLRGKKKKDRLMEMQRQLAAASQGQGKAKG